ncbi:50S ribosomal protein L3 [Candidatus Woesearchaeota archaeon]|nr:50S ribosomal protein L3 [Candidatus Woesearchaeota archaeon]
MPRIRTPRQGSMQYWPRKRAKDIVAHVRTWPSIKEVKLTGFAGYKVGMTHVLAVDNLPTSITKGEEVQVPVTVLECPPVKVAAIILYQKDAYGTHCVGQINAEKVDKEVSRSMNVAKKPAKVAKESDLSEVRVLVHTQPKLTGIGKKAPELFELGIGGNKPQEQLIYAKSLLGKEIKVSDVFAEGQLVDSVSITKGKGLQGPVKRFGLALRSHKSEKTKRGPGSLGPWHGFRGYRSPHQGQMGFQQRMEYNKYIMRIATEDTKKINPKGGFVRYGVVKNQYLLVKGSLGGAHKRLVTLTAPRRASNIRIPKEAPTLAYVSTSSKQ